MPGNASGGMDGVAVKPLTVGFHETQFLGKLNSENQAGFWFQLSDEEKEQAGSSWGPENPQALNRYSYVQNNPLRWVDPTGHQGTAPVDLGDGWYARVDKFNIGGQAYHEVHVYRMENGRLVEKGVFGAQGWINKHGGKDQSGPPSGMSRRTFDRLNAENIKAMRQQGTLPREYRHYRYLPEGQRPPWARPMRGPGMGGGGGYGYSGRMGGGLGGGGPKSYTQ